MDNPGSSLFQGPDIKINNSQNNEEEEDLEDQKRRKEELQNLLTAALDDFNYDESTVNSSTNMSVASFDDMQHNYRQASEPNDQLKVLYEVRCRELSNLKEEYDNYKAETTKEIALLKNKLLLSEAEMRQSQISLKNAEDLLVEKTSNISQLKEALNNKDAHINNYEKTIEKFQVDISAYQTTINELQLQLQADASPFNLAGKRFNSEELQKAHQEQVVKLENLLDEQTKTAKILEKEKTTLRKELQDVMEQKNFTEFEYKNTIKALTKTLEDAQEQCKNLLDIAEMVTTENQHLQERINELNGYNTQEEIDWEAKPLDTKAVLAHMEKLKKMLIDKSMRIDILSAKLRHYENDIKELLEYRQLKCEVYKQEFPQCGNKEHTKSLLLLQNDVQNYKRTIEDKNQQIQNLTHTNKELQEKIEDMLLQTRNEIQNLSHKYSIPQFQQISDELKRSENQVKELQEKLKKSEESHSSLIQKLEKTEKKLENCLKSELELSDVKRSMEKNKNQTERILENQIIHLQNEVEIFTAEIKHLKKYTEDLVTENTKLKLDLREALLKIDKAGTESQMHSTDLKKDYEELKGQLNQVMAHIQRSSNEKTSCEDIANLKCDMDNFLVSLKDFENKYQLEEKISQWKKQLDLIKTVPSTETEKNLKTRHKETLQKLQEEQHRVRVLEETLEDLTSAKTIAEGEKCSYQFQVRDCESQLEHANKAITFLTEELENFKKILKEKEQQWRNSKEINEELQKLREELLCKENMMKICEEEKQELTDLLQKAKLQVEKSRAEVLKLQNEVTEVTERTVRRNLEKELIEAESQLEQSRIEDKNVYETEQFKNCLQTEILKSELKLREDLQQEYMRKLKDVEQKYKKACIATNELYEEQVDKMKNQEIRYREHLARIIADCAQKINEFENEKQNLITQINYLHTAYDDIKKQAEENEEKYLELIKKIKIEAEGNIDEWKKWSKQFVTNCLKIETVNKKSRESILLGMRNVETEIEIIEKSYNDKIRKYLKSNRY